MFVLILPLFWALFALWVFDNKVTLEQTWASACVTGSLAKRRECGLWIRRPATLHAPSSREGWDCHGLCFSIHFSPCKVRVVLPAQSLREAEGRWHLKCVAHGPSVQSTEGPGDWSFPHFFFVVCIALGHSLAVKLISFPYHLWQGGVCCVRLVCCTKLLMCFAVTPWSWKC